MKRLVYVWLLPLATGVLLTVAYPPFHTGQAAWIALVPLLFAVRGAPAGEAFRRGYMAGLVFFAATVWWIVCTTVAGTPVFLAVGVAGSLRGDAGDLRVAGGQHPEWRPGGQNREFWSNSCISGFPT